MVAWPFMVAIWSKPREIKTLYSHQRLLQSNCLEWPAPGARKSNLHRSIHFQKLSQTSAGHLDVLWTGCLWPDLLGEPVLCIIGFKKSTFSIKVPPWGRRDLDCPQTKGVIVKMKAIASLVFWWKDKHNKMKTFMLHETSAISNEGVTKTL